MKSFLKFFASLIVILLLSAFLAPILFRFLPFKFERIFNRLVMVFTLVAVALFVRVRRENFKGYGLGWDSLSLRMFSLSFMTAVVSLTLLVVLKLYLGVAVWSPKVLSVPEWIWVFVKILPAAVLIGVIEEFFFRGFIFSTLRNKFSWNLGLSLVVTNLFYSILHFINKRNPFIGPEPGFRDSLKLITAPFLSFSSAWHEIWPGFIGLFLFGLILNDVYLRSKSLYPGIGLHAGCVFFVKSDRFFVDFINTNTVVWGSARMYDGVMGWLFLILIGWSLRKMIPKQSLKIVAAIFILIGVSASSLLAADKFDSRKSRLPLEPIYSLTDHLAEAEAVLLTEDLKEEKGTWQRDRFVFRGLGSSADIRRGTETISGRPEKVILLAPLAKGSRELRFRKVPPGYQIDFHYKVVSDPQMKTPFLMHLSIWAGEHEIRRLRISGINKEWKKDQINLGVAPFLKQPIFLTFRISSDQPSNSVVISYAEILR